MKRLAHQSVAAAKVAGVEPVYDYAVGQHVRTVDGSGVVVEISPGRVGDETYVVRLDNNLGGGDYTVRQILGLADERTAAVTSSIPVEASFPVEAITDHLASIDYPELAEILQERLPNERVASLRRTAAAGGPDECEWCEARLYPHQHSPRQCERSTTCDGCGQRSSQDDMTTTPGGDKILCPTCWDSGKHHTAAGPNWYSFQAGQRVLADGNPGYILRLVNPGQQVLGALQLYEVVLDYGRGSAVFSQAQLQHTANAYTAMATDWAQHYDALPDEVHRGLFVPRSHDAFVSPASDEDIAHHLIDIHHQEHVWHGSGKEFGTHWTADPQVARDFAKEHEAETKSGEYDTDYDEDRHHGAVPVVFHAQKPPLDHVEQDERRLGWQNVNDHDHPEAEVPFAHGAPIHITGVSWRTHADHPVFGEMWHRHDLRQPVTMQAHDNDSPDDPMRYNAAARFDPYQHQRVWWHGTPSGDLRGASNGLHVGSQEAARQALHARIGFRADGQDWDGTQEYGQTLLAGKQNLLNRERGHYLLTGHNTRDLPDHDHYAHERSAMPTFGTVDPRTGDSAHQVQPHHRPDLFPVRIVGPMTNTPNDPHPDFHANGYMSAQIKRGRAKSGYYYANIGEDSGSISAVVPNGDHLERLPRNEHSANRVRPDLPVPIEPPDACSYCGGTAFNGPQDTGRGVRVICDTCGGAMRSWGGQYEPEFPGSPNNHPSTAADPRAKVNTDVGTIYGPPRAIGVQPHRTASVGDPEFGFHIEASWRDVQAKAKRIRKEGGVRITAADTNGVLGEVRGDTATYESQVYYLPGTKKTAYWACGCKWGGYSWGRSPAYARFEGRPCSHVTALRLEAQSRGMFGRTVHMDHERMEGQYAHSPVTVQYQRPTERSDGGDLNRRTVPPGNMRSEWTPKSRVRTKSSSLQAITADAHVWDERFEVEAKHESPEHARKKRHHHHHTEDARKHAPNFGYGIGYGIHPIIWCPQCNGGGCGHCGGQGQVVGPGGSPTGGPGPGDMSTTTTATGDGSADSGVGGDSGMASAASLHTAMPWQVLHQDLSAEQARPTHVRDAGFKGFVSEHNGFHDEADAPDLLDDHLHHFIQEHGADTDLWRAHSPQPVDVDLTHGVWATQSHVGQHHIDRYVADPHDESWENQKFREAWGEEPQDDFLAHGHPMFVTHQGRLHAMEGHHRTAAAIQRGEPSIPGWHYDLDKAPVARDTWSDGLGDCEDCAYHHDKAQLHAEASLQAQADWSVGDMLGSPGPQWQLYKAPTGTVDSANPGSTGWATSEDPPAWEKPLLEQGFGQTSMSSLHHVAMGQDSCPHDQGWNLHGQCKRCGHIPPTEDDEPCDDPWCVANEPEHSKGEHIDPPHLDPGHADYHSAEHEIRRALDDHPDAWLMDHQHTGPSKYSSQAGWRESIAAMHHVATEPVVPTHAGVVLKAADTGRVLMIQRSNKDEADPARGTWEFPGGGIEEGDKSSLHGAVREFEEEVGQPFPEGGHLTHVWRSGPYVGHVVQVPSEDALDFTNGRSTVNPDDPDGDDHEQSAWWDPEHARKNPALREECKSGPWGEIKKAAARYVEPSSLPGTCRACGLTHSEGLGEDGLCPRCFNTSRDAIGGWGANTTGKFPEWNLAEPGLRRSIPLGEGHGQLHPDDYFEDHEHWHTMSALIAEAVAQGELHDQPEGALPSTDGAAEDDQVEPEPFQPPSDGVVRPPLATAAPTPSVPQTVPWSAMGAPGPQDPNQGDLPGLQGLQDPQDPQGQEQLAAEASLRRVAAKDFSFQEQQEIINEGAGAGVLARNFASLDIAGTHYALLSDEPDDREWWLL